MMILPIPEGATPLEYSTCSVRRSPTPMNSVAPIIADIHIDRSNALDQHGLAGVYGDYKFL